MKKKVKINNLKVEEPPNRPDHKVEFDCPHCKKELTLYLHPAEGIDCGIAKRKCIFCGALLSFEWQIGEKKNDKA